MNSSGAFLFSYKVIFLNCGLCKNDENVHVFDKLGGKTNFLNWLPYFLYSWGPGTHSKLALPFTPSIWKSVDDQ